MVSLTVIECDDRTQLLGGHLSLDVLGISDDVGDTDALNTIDGLVVNVPRHVPVRVLQALHKVGAIGVADEEGANSAYLVQHDIHCEGVDGGLNDGISVLPQARLGSMRELGLGPLLGVHSHIQQHVAITARGQVLECYHCKLGHDGKCQDTFGILADPEVLILLGDKEVGARIEAPACKGVRAGRGRRVMGDTIN